MPSGGKRMKSKGNCPDEKGAKRAGPREKLAKPVSLAPLKFKEAVGGLLRVKTGKPNPRY